MQRYPQVEQCMDFTVSAVGLGFGGKDSDFFWSPILEPRQNGQGPSLKTSCFALRLVPGAEFFLYQEVSGRLFLLLVGTR